MAELVAECGAPPGQRMLSGGSMAGNGKTRQDQPDLGVRTFSEPRPAPVTMVAGRRLNWADEPCMVQGGNDDGRDGDDRRVGG